MANIAANFLSQLILRLGFGLNAARNADEALRGDLHRDTDPIMLQLEVTSRCNYKCRYCIVHNGTGSDVHGDMDMGLFRRILVHFPKSFYVQLQGQGEPLLHPQLTEMVRILEEQRRFSAIITNGSLWTEEVSRELLEAGIDVVAFSLDLCDPEEMEYQRLGMDYSEVAGNLRRLVSLRDEIRPETAIGVSAVLLRSVYKNKDRLHEAVQRLDDLGIDFLVVDPLAGTVAYRDRYPGDLDRERIDPPGPRRLLPFRTRCTVYEAPEVNFFSGRCIWPWMAVYVNHDGGIALCSNNHRVVVGHVDETARLNLQDHVNLRQGFCDDRLPEACEGCQYLLAYRS